MQIKFQFKKVGGLRVLFVNGVLLTGKRGKALGYPTQTKIDNKFLRELHTWLQGETDYELIAEKEDKE